MEEIAKPVDARTGIPMDEGQCSFVRACEDFINGPVSKKEVSAPFSFSNMRRTPSSL